MSDHTIRRSNIVVAVLRSIVERNLTLVIREVATTFPEAIAPWPVPNYPVQFAMSIDPQWRKPLDLESETLPDQVAVVTRQ